MATHYIDDENTLIMQLVDHTIPRNGHSNYSIDIYLGID